MLWPIHTIYCLTWFFFFFFKKSLCLSVIKYLNTSKCFLGLKKAGHNITVWLKMQLFCHLKGCSSLGTIPGTISSKLIFTRKKWQKEKIWTQKISSLQTDFLQLATSVSDNKKHTCQVQNTFSAPSSSLESSHSWTIQRGHYTYMLPSLFDY